MYQNLGNIQLVQCVVVSFLISTLIIHHNWLPVILKHVKNGKAWAQIQLAGCYSSYSSILSHSSIKKDDREAFRLYMLAAKQGDRGAQMFMKHFYDRTRCAAIFKRCHSLVYSFRKSRRSRSSTKSGWFVGRFRAKQRRMLSIYF